MDIRLRPTDAAEDDVSFLRVVSNAVSSGTLSCVDLPDDQLQSLRTLQFEAQRSSYASCHPGGIDHIVVVDGVQVGRLYTDCSTAEITLIDIALLPEFQGRGIGTALLQRLLVDADSQGRPVVLQVFDGSPAERLYGRLGFVRSGSHGLHHEMVRSPSVARSGVVQVTDARVGAA